MTDLRTRTQPLRRLRPLLILLMLLLLHGSPASAHAIFDTHSSPESQLPYARALWQVYRSEAEKAEALCLELLELLRQRHSTSDNVVEVLGMLEKTYFAKFSLPRRLSPQELATLHSCCVDLSDVDILEGAEVGRFSDKSSTYRAYEACFAMGPCINDELVLLTQHASPAGRLYAVLLLRQFNSPAGVEALKEMQTSGQQVRVRWGGCVSRYITMGKAATKLLDQDLAASIFLPRPSRIEYE